MSKSKKILAGVALAALITPLVLAGSCVVRAGRIRSGYEQVTVGASKRDVVALLGEPDDIEACYNLRDDERLRESCAEVYVYYTFLERRGFIFDRDGKLTDKYYNVSH